jgi:hypothetical protein
MNDAVSITSPGDTNETVGNSSKSTKTGSRVQILERDDSSSLGAMWVAFQLKASSRAEIPSKPFTNSQISIYTCYYGTLISNTESGEGVVSSGDVVQTLDYYTFGDERIDNQYGSVDEKRKFVGMERDDGTGLDYAVNRYYDN